MSGRGAFQEMDYRALLGSTPGQTQMAELQKMLWTAERPIAIVGGAG